MKKTDKKPTKAQVKAARKVLALFNEFEELKDMARKRELIGRYFKTRNSYGGDCVGWWMYLTPTHFDDGSLRGLSFQETSVGRLEMETEAYCNYITNESHYTEISESEYLYAKSQFLTAVTARLAQESENV